MCVFFVCSLCVSGSSSLANGEGMVLSDVTSPLRDLFVCVTPGCLGIIGGRIILPAGFDLAYFVLR